MPSSNRLSATDLPRVVGYVPRALQAVHGWVGVCASFNVSSERRTLSHGVSQAGHLVCIRAGSAARANKDPIASCGASGEDCTIFGEESISCQVQIWYCFVGTPFGLAAR